MIYMKIARYIVYYCEWAGEREENSRESFEKSKHLLRYYSSTMLHIICNAFNITWYIILRATFQKPYNNVSVLYVCVYAKRYRITHCDIILIEIADLTQTRIKYTSIWFIHGKQHIFIDFKNAYRHTWNETKCNRIGKECAALCATAKI